jgi:hypothetical protein
MVSRMEMRVTWTAGNHVRQLNNAARDRDVLIHPTALAATVSQLFVKVSAVTRARRSTSTSSIILPTPNKYLYTCPSLRKDVLHHFV